LSVLGTTVIFALANVRTTPMFRIRPQKMGRLFAPDIERPEIPLVDGNKQ